MKQEEFRAQFSGHAYAANGNAFGKNADNMIPYSMQQQQQHNMRN